MGIDIKRLYQCKMPGANHFLTKYNMLKGGCSPLWEAAVFTSFEKISDCADPWLL